MKKKFAVLFLMLALAISAIGGTVAFAQVSLEECDKCFQATISGLVDGEDVDGGKIAAERKPVYDIDLQQLGYVYEFEISSGNGYAIIICDDGNYVAQEMVTKTQSPYIDVADGELCVYVNSLTYLKYFDGAFYDLATLEEISSENVALLRENAIIYKASEGLDYESVSVTVNYQSRTSDAKTLSKSIPHYTSPGGLESACAAVAGCNLIGFYDRYYEHLIPNHTAGFESYGYYLYNVADAYVYDCIRNLYAKMDGSAAGITESNFIKGMQNYCAEKGLTCDFNQLLSSGKLNYDAVKQSIAENNPVVLMLSTYNICSLSGLNGADVFDYQLSKGNHMMAGFGYCQLNYTLNNGAKQTYKFIEVATGFARMSEAYFNIDYSTNINSAYKVYIH